MYSIGVTGGIGCGKTTICKKIEQLGFSVYYADERAKVIMVDNPTIREGVIQLFGDKAYLEDGSLHRKHIAAIAFTSPEKLQALNALVHPFTRRDYLEWKESQATNSNYPMPFVFKEAAILYESGAYKDCDAVWLVYAPKAVRIERVIRRDTTEKASVLARMAKQLTDNDKINRADFVLYNDGVHSLDAQISDAMTFLRKKLL